MAKALLGYLAGPDLDMARLVADNASLRSRVSALTAEVAELTAALSAANAVADGRLADLVETDRTTRTEQVELEAALREVPEGAPA